MKLIGIDVVARIFISHSTKDRAFVEQHIVHPLRAINYEPWFSADSIRGSEHWERSILGGLNASKWFFLAMSPQSAESEYVKDEVAWAVDERPKKLVPILINDCDKRDFHLRIPRIQHFDFRVEPQVEFERVKSMLAASDQVNPMKSALLKQLDKKSAHDFWSPLSEGGLQIVMGRFTQFPDFERSGLLGYGDAAAMLDLRTHLESLLISKTAVTFADKLEGESLRTNLVLLGGPDTNKITDLVFPTLSRGFKFDFPTAGQIDLVDTVNAARYSPTPQNDFGLILRGKNPFDESKTVLIAAGAFGYGTWAAIRALISDDFVAADTTAAEFALEGLVECKVAWEMPSDVSIRFLRAA